MDFTRLAINRRTALLTSAAIAANVINPLRAFAQETPRKGGVFNVHYGAEQRQLNPSIQRARSTARTGVPGAARAISARWRMIHCRQAARLANAG